MNLIDPITDRIVAQQAVSVEFESCQEPSESSLELRCGVVNRGRVVTCRVVNAAVENLAWHIQAAREDGEKGETITRSAGTRVELPLPANPGGRPDEVYLVSATGVDASGRTLGGRTSAHRSRSGYRMRMQFGQLVLRGRHVEGDTHEVTNTADEILELEQSAELEHRPCTPGGETRRESISTEQILGITRIPANARLTIHWEPARAEGVCGHRLVFRGVGAKTGMDVVGALRARTRRGAGGGSEVAL